MNKKLEEFSKRVPLSNHKFELKHEPEETSWTLWVLFNRKDGKIISANVNRAIIADYKSHRAVGFETAQWVEAYISNKEARELKAKIEKLDTIFKIPNWIDGVCQCRQCGTYE